MFLFLGMGLAIFRNALAPPTPSFPQIGDEKFWRVPIDDLQKGVDHTQRSRMNLSDGDVEIAPQEFPKRMRIEARVENRDEILVLNFGPMAEGAEHIVHDVANRLSRYAIAMLTCEFCDEDAIGPQQFDCLGNTVGFWHAKRFRAAPCVISHSRILIVLNCDEVAAPFGVGAYAVKRTAADLG